jgi:hypothetical protein
MGVIDKLLSGLVETLHNLHVRGVTHGDVKPANIVVMDDTKDGFDARLIDFGCATFHNRNPVGKHGQDCTYPYAPPEMFSDNHADKLKTDAYSVGAVLYEMLYRDCLYNCMIWSTFHQVGRMHRDGVIQYPDEGDAPPGIPAHVYDAMVHLLDPNPVTRMTIAELYQAYNHKELAPESPTHLFQPNNLVHWDDARDRTIDLFFQRSDTKVDFAMACNLADRFVERVQRPPTTEETVACAQIAQCLTEYVSSTLGEAEKTAICDVLVALRFELYAETCDTVLINQLGYACLDYELLKQAIKATNGRAMHAVTAFENLWHKRYGSPVAVVSDSSRPLKRPRTAAGKAASKRPRTAVGKAASKSR